MPSLTPQTADFENGHSAIDAPPSPRGSLPWNPLFVSSSQDSYGCLRLNVVAGTDLEATLGVGEMPFLYAIGQLQKAKWLGTHVGNQAERNVCSIFHVYSEPTRRNEINPLDPWLFTLATGTQDEQREFYGKVWRLHMYFNCHIFVFAVGQGAILKLIKPDFAKLEVRITLGIGTTSDADYTLAQDEAEGTSYRLSLSSTPQGSPSMDEASWREHGMQDGYFANGNN